MRILHCECAVSHALPEGTVDLVRRLLAGRTDVVRVPDLCRLVAAGDPLLPSLAAEPLLIIACRPRAVRALFRQAGVPLVEPRFLDQRTGMEIPAALDALLPDGGGPAPAVAPTDDDWIPF